MFRLRIATLLFGAVAHVTAQCSNTCPPLDTAGNPVASLCVGDDTSKEKVLNMQLPICYPANRGDVTLSDYFPGSGADAPSNLVVMANHYVGCGAGRREAAVFTYTATMIHSQFPNVVFLSSLKGGVGSQCLSWSGAYEAEGEKLLPNGMEITQPQTVEDTDSTMRDAFFTAPYPHPSYVIVDHKGVVRHKFVGPCCEYAGYNQCSMSMALALNETLYTHIHDLLDEIATDVYGGSADCFVKWSEWSECDCDSDDQSQSRTRTILQNAIGSGTCSSQPTETRQCDCVQTVDCSYTAWSPWSVYDQTCGNAKRYKTRSVAVSASGGGAPCTGELIEWEYTTLPACTSQCVAYLGESINVVEVANAQQGLSSPRDVAFSPVPGAHLGSFSSGREFSVSGQEAWVANGDDASVTIITGIGADSSSGSHPSLTRYDRGYYHYMINISALSFNSVPPSESNRDPSRDTFGFFATCQDSNNTYGGRKEPNWFMGPSLYNSNKEYKNLVAHDGSECTDGDECFFLHSDMLHESPSCPGIVHDPETTTAYGTVYWAIDGVVNELVRYDFQQPHGPGLMDHSYATVRRYPDVHISKGPHGLHQGMVVDGEARFLYISDSANNQIIRAHIDTGTYARTAREEYPIFSSRLPSFEYSIYECMTVEVFATGIDLPSGLALSPSNSQLFVAEHNTGKIHVYNTKTGDLVNSYDTIGRGLMGLSFATLSTGETRLFGVNSLTHQLLHFAPSAECSQAPQPYANPDYVPHSSAMEEDKSESECTVNTVIPNIQLFDQVHLDSGYADTNDAVQNDNEMDAAAALLADRTDCGYDSELNFDALLLGGYFCHVCLPDNCRDGGKCTNIQWRGYSCDNEFYITYDETNGFSVSPSEIELTYGSSYRFIVESPNNPVHVAGRNGEQLTDSVESGTLVIEADDSVSSIMGHGGILFPIRVVGGFDFGSERCEGGTGSFVVQLPGSKDIVDVPGIIPTDKYSVSVALNATGIDIDVQLIDLSSDVVTPDGQTGQPVVKWCAKAAHCAGAVLGQSATPDDSTYKPNEGDAMSLSYSGYNGVDFDYGMEWIKIHSATTTTLKLRAYAYGAPGPATVSYSWGASQSKCCLGQERCASSFERAIKDEGREIIGKIPIGTTDLVVELNSDQDLDIQVYDEGDTADFVEGKAVIAWCKQTGCNVGLLSGATEDNVVYEGVTFKYSGYNGVNNKAGHERITIEGTTTTPLLLVAYAYHPGTARVDYSYLLPLTASTENQSVERRRRSGSRGG